MGRVLVGFVGLVAFGCQAEVRSHPAAILDGRPSTEAAVVALVERQPVCGEAEPLVVCTATFVAPDVLLTAAHCVVDRAPSSLATSAEGESIPVRSAQVHPSFDRVLHHHDLALLHLARASVVAPLPLADAPPEPDTLVRVVGFGQITSDATRSEGRHEGTSRVARVDVLTLELAPEPSNTCRGDSGGPTLVDDTSGTRVVGVTSFGDAVCETVGVAARVDVDLAWIRDAIEARPEASGTASRARLCARGCETSRECPADFECEDGSCVFAGIPPGEYGAACESDDVCTCVALPDGCRCYTPCDEAGGGGCAVGSTRGLVGTWLLGLLVAGRRGRTRALMGARGDSRTNARA